MYKPMLFLMLPALVLAACAPLTTPTVEPIQVSVASATPTPSPANESPLFLSPSGRVIIRSASYTVIAADPAQALADLEAAIEKAGGYVSSASSSASGDSYAYANLSARVPADQLPAIREAVLKIADSIQYQSYYVSDVTTDYRNLQQRDQDVSRARDQIWQLMARSNDLSTASTYRVMLELLDNESKNVQSQMDSYQQQAELASLDVTFNQSAAPVISE